MGIVADILGRITPKGKAAAGLPDTIAGCEAALAQLNVERTRADLKLKDLYAKRQALLESDAPDEAIIAIDVERDRLGIIPERLEALEENLFAQMRKLKGDARSVALAAARSRFVAKCDEFEAAFNATHAAFTGLLDEIDLARASGFEQEFMRGQFPAPPSIIGISDPAFLEIWRGAVDGNADAQSTVRATSPRALPATASKPITAPRKVSLAETGAPRETAPARTPIVERPEPGELLVEILRSGIEPREGLQCIRGDRIALPADQARAIASNGAGTIVELQDEAAE